MALDHNLLEQAKARARAARNAALARMHGGASSSREDAIREAVARARAAVARASQYGGGSSSREDAIREAVARARAAAAQDGGAYHIKERLAERKSSNVRHVGRKAGPRKTGLLNPRLRTYVAAVGQGRDSMKFLRGLSGETNGNHLYFHGLPNAAAKKVLTALTKTRMSAAQRTSNGRHVGKNVNGSAQQNYTLVPKGSITQSNPIRIVLVEVTKGLRKKTAQPAGSLNYGSGMRKNKPSPFGKYYQYKYYGYQEPTNATFEIRSVDKQGVPYGPKRPVAVANKNVVVKISSKEESFQDALAKKNVKATQARAALKRRGYSISA